MPAHTSSKLTPLAKALLMRNAFRARLPVTGLGLMLSMGMAAQVQAQEWSLNIPAQPLDKALQAFAEQVNVQVLYNPSDVQSLRSTALNGRYDLDRSISTLLQGTGVHYQLTGNTLTLLPPASGAAMELSSVTISGKAPGSITEGTGSYTTYATSSATRLNLAPKDTPQSITVLTSQRIEDQHLGTLEDTLQAIPGVAVQHVNGYGTETPTINARGSTLNSFQIDGVQTSNALQAYLQSTAIYDRIEVVRGATGLMNSLGSPAATINMIRKRPTYEPQASFSVEAGNWDRYGGDLDVSAPLTETGNVRGRLVADYKRQGSWTDNFKQESLTLYGITELDLNDSTLLTLGASHITRDTQAPTGRMPLFYGNGQRFQFDASDNDGPAWTYYDHELTNAFASIEHQFNSSWSGKIEINYAEHNSNSLYGILGSVPRPGAGSTISSMFRYQPTNRQTTLDAYVTGSFSLFGRDHELISGVTISDLQTKAPSYNARYSAGSFFVSDYLSLVDTLPKPDQITEIGKSVTSEKQNSAYMSARFSLTDATNLLLGGRVTDWRRDVDSLTYSTGATSERVNKSTGLFVPYAGIVYALDETWSIYTSYTKIFNPQPSRYLDINDMPLAPEEGTSYEAGIKASFNEGRLNASLSLYKTELDNRAIWYTSGGRTVYDTESGTETKGVELELSGELAEDWQIGAGYSYNDIRDSNDERLLTTVPQHIVKTFTTYRMSGAFDRVTLGGGFDWNSKTKTSGYVQGSYGVANLMARYKINENLTASININNIFDREYLTSYSTWGAYGPPRNVMSSLKYSF